MMSSINTASAAYAEILEAYEALPWGDAAHHHVTKIAPQGHPGISFFPGQRGFVGPAFPVGGVMIVANNYDNLAGWNAYRPNLAAEDTSRTMVTFLNHVLPHTGRSLEHFWFTNYCLGVMDRPTSQYKFAHQAAKALKFDHFFERCVQAMRPQLIVSLGAYAAEWLRTDFARRERIDERVIGGHSTRLLAVVHTSAWTWNRKGFSFEDFAIEGRRIREAITIQ